MSKKVHLVMPMAGAGSRFEELGYKIPKPLIQIGGKPFFYWAVMSIAQYVEVEDITFAVLEKHIEQFDIANEITKLFPSAKIVKIQKVLKGPVLTCKEAIKDIGDGYPIVFNDCDHVFRCKEFEEFLESQESISGGILTFSSNLPQYSYVRKDSDNNIIGTVEKEVVSDEAICGAYYVKNREIYENMMNYYLENCSYSEYFMSGIYNEMCAQNLQVKSFKCDFHISYGTPEEFVVAKEEAFFYNN